MKANPSTDAAPIVGLVVLGEGNTAVIHNIFTESLYMQASLATLYM